MKCKPTLGVSLAALFLLAALSTPVSAQSNQSGLHRGTGLSTLKAYLK